MIVVDTNIIGALYLSSDRSTQAERALRKDPYWAAPIRWRSEFRNVLAHYLHRNLLSLEDTIQFMDEAVSLMKDREYEINSYHVLNLVVSSTCSAYDCEFVSLAQDLAVPLVTVDSQILRQFPSTATSLEAFT